MIRILFFFLIENHGRRASFPAALRRNHLHFAGQARHSGTNHAQNQRDQHR